MDGITCVYCKPTHTTSILTGLQTHQNIWKTVKSLVKRTFTIVCSSSVNAELNHLTTKLNKYNENPLKVINNIFKTGKTTQTPLKKP